MIFIFSMISSFYLSNLEAFVKYTGSAAARAEVL